MSVTVITKNGGVDVITSQKVTGIPISVGASGVFDIYETLGDGLSIEEKYIAAFFLDNETAKGNDVLKDNETILGFSGANKLVDYVGGKVSTLVNNPTTSRKGITTNGIDQYADTNFNPAVDGVNYIQNNAFVGAFVESGISGFIFGNNLGNERVGIRYEDLLYRINNAGLTDPLATPSNDSLYLVSRTAAFVSDLYENGVSIDTSGLSSSGINSENIFMGGLNSGGLIAPFEGTIGAFTIGASVGFDHLSYEANLRALLIALRTLS